jgi:hypothetical protein
MSCDMVYVVGQWIFDFRRILFSELDVHTGRMLRFEVCVAQ